MDERPREKPADEHDDEDVPREQERGILELFHKPRDEPGEDAPLERNPAE